MAGTVKRGPIEIQVRGLGRLTPEEIHWIAAAAGLPRFVRSFIAPASTGKGQ